MKRSQILLKDRNTFSNNCCLNPPNILELRQTLVGMYLQTVFDGIQRIGKTIKVRLARGMVVCVMLEDEMIVKHLSIEARPDERFHEWKY